MTRRRSSATAINRAEGASRDYDWSVEEHGTVDSLRRRLAVEGPTFLAHVGDVSEQGRLDEIVTR